MKSFVSRHRRLLILGALVAAAWLGHALVLRGLARALVVEEPATPAQYVCLLGGESGAMGQDAFAWAADFYRADPARRILLIEPLPDRLVEIGAVASFEQLGRRELQKRGVPASAVFVIGGQARDEWEATRHLGTWLAARPGQVVLACDRFRSRYFRYLLDHTLAPADAARAHTLILSAPDLAATNWWRSRSGVKQVMFGWLELLYAWVPGEDRYVPVHSSSQAYQALIRAKLGEGGR